MPSDVCPSAAPCRRFSGRLPPLFPPLPPLPFTLHTQASRLACVEPLVPGLLSMLEGVPSRLKLLLTRYVTPVTADSHSGIVLRLDFIFNRSCQSLQFGLRQATEER